MATKNTFQMMGERQASSSNLHNPGVLGGVPQPLKNNLVSGNVTVTTTSSSNAGGS